MDEYKRDPREDISLIRQMLERAMDGMKIIAPWFTGLGIAWLIYGAFSAFQRIAMLHVSLSAAGRLSAAGSVIGTLACVLLAAGFLICRCRLGRLGLDSLARKLVDTWGVCIFLFLILTILLNPVISMISVRLGSSAEAATALYKACAVCRSFLYFLFPVAPLLITAAFLDSRRMLFAGIGLAIITALVMCCNAILLFVDNLTMEIGWGYLLSAAACLLDLAPGVMLLVFGRQLKGR